MEMSAIERKGWYCVWAAVANLLGGKGGSAAVAEKCTSFIWLDFPDHKSADLEGHPHSLTIIHKPLASTNIGITANIYNSKGCSLTAWQGVQHGRASATLGFCASASAMGTPNAQGEVNQMSVRLSNLVWDTISWDRWCGCYTGPRNRGGGRLCAIRKEVLQLEGESTLFPGTPESVVPPSVRHSSCNAAGSLSLIRTYVYTPIQTIY